MFRFSISKHLQNVSYTFGSRLPSNTNSSSRKFASMAERAAAMMYERVRDVAIDSINEDLEQNKDIWLSAASVDSPTVSILDPVEGYSRENLRQTSQSSYASIYNTKANPFALVEDDIRNISDSIQKLLACDHPVLSAVATYFFGSEGGKKIRPSMVLLVSAAASIEKSKATNPPLDYVEAAQKRLAEITEMIHTASLLHDDVIDEADTRRGQQSANKVFGSKLSILAGDFLLARSSICLARLRNLEAIELMSTAIEHLVKGEVMQMRIVNGENEISPFECYLRKNYYKTGSLMSNSCKAALVLGGHSENICNLGFSYGRHLGLAFQLIDDILDYAGNDTGKPMLADLKAGLVTAPVLLAQEEYPILTELAARKFSRAGDVELAAEYVDKSSGIQKTRELAISQAELACDAIMQFPPSEYRDALITLAQKVIHRTK